MRLYVINLDRSPDRLVHIAKVFADLGLEFTRIPAVDGNILEETEYQHLTKKHLWPERPSRPEAGCFLSHRKFLQMVVEKDEPYAAVFEDDAQLSPQIKPLLDNHDWIKPGTDMVKLDVGYSKECWVEYLHKTSIEPYKIGRLMSGNYAAAGYIISREAAVRFLARTEYVHIPIDIIYFDPNYGELQKFNIQQLIPAPVIQSDLFASDNINTSAYKDVRKIPRAERSLFYTIKREIWRFYHRHMRPMGIFLGYKWLKGWHWYKIPFG